MKKASFILLAVLATLGGLYPAVYFMIDRRFSLLGLKSEELLADTLWNITFYIHIILGGVVLLVGWTQFVSKWRNRNWKLHRQIGKLYIICVLISAITSFYIAMYATGGGISTLGFMGMGLVWFYTTYSSYTAIRKRKVLKHQQMMVYSYATCMAAVTLRIELPLFTAIFDDFNKAYVVLSWFSWVPNLLVAYFIIRKYHTKKNILASKRVAATA